jgi:hypothetical protein
LSGRYVFEVLFLLFGSSAAGKTSALNGLRDRMPDLAVHDHDEIGVPPAADTVWRQQANEEWVRRALEYQAAGTDLILAAQTPFGELLATPSAVHLDAISACLLDCRDEVRIARLRQLPVSVATSDPARWPDFLKWAEWMRRHATDPHWMPHVIRREGSPDMCWKRWSDWQIGDPRWRVHVVDTSALSTGEVADELARWVTAERGLARRMEHPLASCAALSKHNTDNR